jgi:hypothetical protein
MNRDQLIRACRAKMAGFSQPGITLCRAFITGIKADDRPQQQRVSQPMRQVKLPAN